MQKTVNISSNWKISKEIYQLTKTQPIPIGAILQDLSCPQNFGIVSRVNTQ